MNDETIEGLLRTRLRAMAPSDVPQGMAVRAMAIARVQPERSERRVRGRHGSRPRLRLAFALAVAMVVVIAAGTLTGQFADRGAAAPSIPSLPAIAQAPLPPGVKSPTRIFDGAWINPTVAWLVGDHSDLYITEDGGQTWSGPRQLDPDLRGRPTFLDASFGYAMWTRAGASPVEATLVLTTDGGRTWSYLPVGTIPSEQTGLRAHFADRLHGVVMSSGTTGEPATGGSAEVGVGRLGCGGWATDDGGQTWAAISGVPCSGYGSWASPSLGVYVSAAAGASRASVTTDGGRSWTDRVLPLVGPDDTVYPIVFDRAPDGALELGYSITKSGESIWKSQTLYTAESRDGGASWAPMGQGANMVTLPTLISSIGSGHWITSGAGTYENGMPSIPILESADSGRTWVTTGSLGTLNGSVRSFFDRLHGMAWGADTAGCGTLVITECHGDGWYLTNDGGVTWHGLPF
jgi:hypothetical protein